jgi:DNA ligase (NAD+)
LTLDKFIFSLGIRYIGSKNSKILAKRLGSLNNLINSNLKTLESIRDIGDKVANSLILFFKDKKNQELIKKLINLGVNIQKMKIPKSNIFTNLTFVITGTLTKPRKHFMDIIESYNGNVSNLITSKTDYLLVGKNVGNKLLKAKELNISILNEKQFNEKIKEKNE